MTKNHRYVGELFGHHTGRVEKNRRCVGDFRRRSPLPSWSPWRVSNIDSGRGPEKSPIRRGILSSLPGHSAEVETVSTFFGHRARKFQTVWRRTSKAEVWGDAARFGVQTATVAVYYALCRPKRAFSALKNSAPSCFLPSNAGSTIASMTRA